MPLLAPEVLYPRIQPVHIQRNLDWLTGNLYDKASNLLVLAMHSFIIHAKSGLILIDTCSGNDRERPQKTRYHRNNWPYLERLKQAGVAPDDIKYVLCTHLHVDHVGWNTHLLNGKWVPTFKNAKYLFNKTEWEFWRSEYETTRFTDDPYYLDSILPIIDAGQYELIDNHYDFDENVAVEPSPGHTPGHISIRLNSNGSHAIFTGDIMHHALQCAEPQLSSCFCVDDKHSYATRLDLLQTSADTDTLILPAHFPTPSFGRIKTVGDSFRFAFVDESKTSY